MAIEDMLQTRANRVGLRQLLADDHRRVQEIAMRVAACVNADDPHGALDEWPAFEEGLLTHMNVEEMLIIPRFAEIAPEDAARLRDEHAKFRGDLGHLAMCLELHIARKPMFDALVSALWRHAEHEEEIMYVWAERTLPERVVDALGRRLAHR